MSESDFTYKSQDVNYLGFLEAQLRDLQGIDTLAYELIQNADDVRDEHGLPQTTWLTFDVTDEALVVENDGVFRPVDFERLQNIAGGGKRQEAGTTGAFGLGFIAVYQITDAPEIFSNGIHWTIRPQAPPDRRIQERRVETEGTRFRLPWAFDDASPVRRTLRIEAVRPQDLDHYADAIAGAIELAALFLQQLQVLEVRRNGKLVRRIEREAVATHQIVLHDSRGAPTTWLLFQGHFGQEANALREQYAWQIETQRHSDVRLALPADMPHRPGRLFAVLPTDTTFPLPGYISADFFPTTDRKRIHFDGGYQARWNEAAMRCAAETLAQNLSLLPDLLGHRGLWQLLQKAAETEQMVADDLLPAAFASFWRALAPHLSKAPIAYTATEEWRPAPDVRLVTREAAIPLLLALHIPVAHPDLIPYVGLLQRDAVGARQLSIEDLRSGLQRVDLTRPTPLHDAPAPLRSLDAWQEVWALIDRLLDRSPGPRERAAALEQLGRYALVLGDSMILFPLNRVYRGGSEARALFPDVPWVHPALPPDTFPGRYVQQFGARQAVERLAETPIDRLEDAWRMGRLDLSRLFRWFESRQIEIFADDPSLQKEIRRLPLCPVEGELRPLGDLYLPGGFEDPLRVAGIIDLQALGGRREFLRDLGVRELDFDAYLHSYLPRLFDQDPDLPSDALHRLAQLLARRLGQFRDDDELQEILSRLPLVACMDGSFRPANVVYESRE
ncbi:MAG: sacsin N-terminal ATP-binding-like domain-containing protein, partial [Chloroflexota bacterium]